MWVVGSSMWPECDGAKTRRPRARPRRTWSSWSCARHDQTNTFILIQTMQASEWVLFRPRSILLIFWAIKEDYKFMQSHWSWFTRSCVWLPLPTSTFYKKKKKKVRCGCLVWKCASTLITCLTESCLEFENVLTYSYSNPKWVRQFNG